MEIKNKPVLLINAVIDRELIMLIILLLLYNLTK